jgi:hypothetical protein
MPSRINKIKTISTKSRKATLATMLLDSKNSLVPCSGDILGVTGIKLPEDILPKVLIIYISIKLYFETSLFHIVFHESHLNFIFIEERT